MSNRVQIINDCCKVEDCPGGVRIHEKPSSGVTWEDTKKEGTLNTMVLLEEELVEIYDFYFKKFKK